MDDFKELFDELDEYLCHQRFFHFSMKFGNTSSVTVEPYKASWLVSQYYNYELKRQVQVNEPKEALVEFKKMCEVALREENMMLRNKEQTSKKQ